MPGSDLASRRNICRSWQLSSHTSAEKLIGKVFNSYLPPSFSEFRGFTTGC